MSCKSSKQVFDPMTSDKKYLKFGTGGGFTGKVLTYYILEDGSVYTKIGEEVTKIGNAGKQMTTQVFANYETLGLHKVSLNEPGNKYSFIEKSNGEEKNMIQWGKEPLENTNIDTYFAILMNIVKNIKP